MIVLNDHTKNKIAIVIAGPTGIGKTQTAIHLSRALKSAPIISADSRQCYKEMNIGVARPSADELLQAPHYFVASHSVTDIVNAGVFEQYALQLATEFFKTHNYIIVCGGTGLYIDAFCNGLDEVPPTNEAIREKLNRLYNHNGLAWLQQEVSVKDPLFFASGEIKNPHRLLRALEVMESTGKSITQYRTNIQQSRPFQVIKFCLQLPRAVLYERINTRVNKMMEQGLLNEVQQLLPYRHLKALNTVGYAELFNYLDNNISLQQAVDKIKQHTRNYAKRQITWFNKDKYIPVQPEDMSFILGQIKEMEG